MFGYRGTKLFGHRGNLFGYRGNKMFGYRGNLFGYRGNKMFGYRGNSVIEVKICSVIEVICSVIEIQKRSVIKVFLPR